MKKKQINAELGADIVINHYTEDVEKRVREIFNEGVDIVIDHVGKATFEKSIKCLKKGGRLVFFGTTTGDTTEINIRYNFTREISLKGVYMRRKGDLFKITELFKKGILKPVVNKVFNLKDAGIAHKYLEESKHFGKVVLKVN
ncbi:MAG: zinc-binding dehydrogenase [Candidatus Bathyarchaeia archaeon]